MFLKVMMRIISELLEGNGKITEKIYNYIKGLTNAH